MSKKKDFKGVTSEIVTNKVTSLDNFFGVDNQSPTHDKASPKETAPEVSKSSKSKSITTPNKAFSAEDEPEKTRISLFIKFQTSYDLEELKMRIRRYAPRNDMSKISKSSIVEAAIDIVKADFEENGMDSALVKNILE